MVIQSTVALPRKGEEIVVIVKKIPKGLSNEDAASLFFAVVAVFVLIWYVGVIKPGSAVSV